MKRLAPRALGRIKLAKPERIDEQTLSYPFDASLAWFASHYLRTPSRVLWDVGRFESTRLEPLYDEVYGWLRSGPCPGWLANGQRFSVAVRNVDDFEAGPLQVRGTIKNALLATAKHRAIDFTLDVQHPTVRFLVRKDVLSVDVAGQALHARGWRTEHGEAPLKETVAAQMLILARWDARSEVLVDPMCGSGTIAIEGAAAARGAPLWTKKKRPDAAAWPMFADQAPFDRDLFEGTAGKIVGNDLDADAVNIARRNAGRAGAESVTFTNGDFRKLTRNRIAELANAEPDTPILILTNPPYGERIEKPEALYEDLRDWWLGLGPNVRLGVLAEDPKTKDVLGKFPSLEKMLPNGPLKTRLLVYSSS